MEQDRGWPLSLVAGRAPIGFSNLHDDCDFPHPGIPAPDPARHQSQRAQLLERSIAFLDGHPAQEFYNRKLLTEASGARSL